MPGTRPERGIAVDPVAGHQPAETALGYGVGAGDFGLGLAGQDGGDDEATFRHLEAVGGRTSLLRRHADVVRHPYSDVVGHPIPMS